MKKIVALGLVAFLALSCNQTKIAYIEIDEVIKEYKGMKDAQKELDARETEFKRALDQLAVGYQNGLKDYQEKARSMSMQKRQETESQLMQQQQLLNQQQQQAQQELQKFGQDKMDEINETIQDFVSDYAKSNGYTYILGTSNQSKAVLYGENSLDITDAIIEAVNDEYKANAKRDLPEEKKDSLK